jgi:hypothetical protein
MVAPESATESFSWAKTGLGEATFNGLASLTSIRNRSGFGPATTVNENEEFRKILQAEPGERLPKYLIKRMSHDGFSELASLNDSARQSASAALIEWKSKSAVFLARNSYFSDREKTLFQELVVEMHQLSQVAAYGPVVRLVLLKTMQS